MKLLKASDFKEMPWSNGGGVTHEIARQDDESGLLWRVSTARVEADCDYSLFPGLTRWSAVVEGNGVYLTNSKTQMISTVAPSDIVKLSGDVLYHGKLIDGGFRHLNLVFDPKRIAAEMTLVGSEIVDIADGPTHLVYCCSGRIADWNSLAASKGDVLVSLDGETLYPDDGALGVLISLMPTA